MNPVEELVARAQTGDKAAYEAIVRRFEKMAFGYAYSLLGDHDLAEDARQDAFLDAWCDLMALKNPASFPAWLRRIVYRQSINYVRGRRILTVPLDGAAEVAQEGPGPADQLSALETRRQVE